MWTTLATAIRREVGIAPLITFRICFGALMLLACVRFVFEGWIEELYIKPGFFFKYYGFEWVTVLSPVGMYGLLSLIGIFSVMIMLGLFYRLAAIGFFFSFCYLELIDASNYLNHYYLVCIFSFMLIFLPANASFSLDVLRKPEIRLYRIPQWMTGALMAQLAIVYSFAGLAKLSPDWLFHARPLSIWFAERSQMPLIGPLLSWPYSAYIASWFAAIYDCSIACWLLIPSTRKVAYVFVLVFHLLTWLFFNIGLFPLIMILSTLVFFPAPYHECFLSKIGFRGTAGRLPRQCIVPGKYIAVIFACLLFVQTLMPLRHLLYPGSCLWTEEGYRFSWRVMLVEKSGHATFRVSDKAQGRHTEIRNNQYLTDFQEKQMSIQPDFILQFAHRIAEEYRTKHGMSDPIVRVDAFVSLNGRSSRRLIDPKVNLAKERASLYPKSWILARDKTSEL